MLPLGLGYHIIIVVDDMIIIMLTIYSTKDGRSRLSRPDALFHSSHLGSEFRVLVLRLSVPNRVWDFMGSPLLTYLASNISSGGPSWFYLLQRVCVGWRPSCFRNNSGQRRLSSFVGPHLEARGLPTSVWVANPTSSRRQR